MMKLKLPVSCPLFKYDCESLLCFTNEEAENQNFFPLFPFQEALDGIEFARGDANSTWGSVRAAMGRKEPFELKYVAIGNEDCGKTYYRGFAFLYDHI